ncbi:MAG: hypothetical protein ABI469_00870 [Gemmatimonadales bacterium]
MRLFKARFEPLREASGRLYGREVPEDQECTADLRIVLRAALAFSDMTLHANQLDTGEGIVYKSDVLITKVATIH